MASSTLFIMLVYFLPESPIWNVRRGNISKAEMGLALVRGSEYNYAEEMKEMSSVAKSTSHDETLQQKFKYLSGGNVLKPFSLLILLFIIQVKPPNSRKL